MATTDRVIQNSVPELAELAASGNGPAFSDAVDDVCNTLLAVIEARGMPPQWAKGAVYKGKNVGGQVMPKSAIEQGYQPDGTKGDGGKEKVRTDFGQIREDAFGKYASAMDKLDKGIADQAARNAALAEAAKGLDQFSRELNARDRKKLVKGVKDSISGVLSLMGGLIGEAADYLDDKLDVSSTLEDMLDFAAETREKAAQLTADAGDAIKDMKDWAGDVAATAQEMAADASGYMMDGAKDIGRAAIVVRDAAKALAEDTGEAIAEKASALSSSATELVKKIKDALPSLADLKKVGQDLRDKSAELRTAINTKIGQTATDIQQWAEAPLNSLGVIAEQAGTIANDTFKALQKKASELGTKLTELKDQVMESEAVQGVISKAQELQSQLSSLASEVSKKGKELSAKAGAEIKAAKDAAKEFSDKTIDKAQKQLDQLANTEIGKVAAAAAKKAGTTLQEGAAMVEYSASAIIAMMNVAMNQIKYGLLGQDPGGLEYANTVMNEALKVEMRDQMLKELRMEREEALEKAVHAYVEREHMFYNSSKMIGSKIKVPGPK